LDPSWKHSVKCLSNEVALVPVPDFQSRWGGQTEFNNPFVKEWIRDPDAASLGQARAEGVSSKPALDVRQLLLALVRPFWLPGDPRGSRSTRKVVIEQEAWHEPSLWPNEISKLAGKRASRGNVPDFLQGHKLV
jgi:hypothetical protein